MFVIKIKIKKDRKGYFTRFVGSFWEFSKCQGVARIFKCPKEAKKILGKLDAKGRVEKIAA
jgi:hypothetical protein